MIVYQLPDRPQDLPPYALDAPAYTAGDLLIEYAPFYVEEGDTMVLWEDSFLRKAYLFFDEVFQSHLSWTKTLSRAAREAAAAHTKRGAKRIRQAAAKLVCGQMLEAARNWGRVIIPPIEQEYTACLKV